MMMISEIFYWFEIKTLPIVTGAGLSQKATGHEEGQGKNALQIVMFDLKLIISTGQTFKEKQLIIGFPTFKLPVSTKDLL